MTFIPSINLDEEVIRTRFGEPDQRTELEGVVHFLYPEKGLDVVIIEEGKEVIQYVVPRDFGFTVETKER